MFSITVLGWNFFLGLQVPPEGSGARLYPCLKHTGKPVTQEVTGPEWVSLDSRTSQSYCRNKARVKTY